MKNKSSFNRRIIRENIAGYLFVAPAIISFIVFIGIPIIFSFAISFLDFNLLQPPEFVGLKYYNRLISDSSVLTCLKNNFKFFLILVPLHVILAMLLALLVANVGNSKMKHIFRSAIYFPSIVTTASVAIAWGYMFSTDSGFVNYYVRSMGFENIPWLTDATMCYVTIALFSIWKFIGTNFLYYFIGIQNIPDVYYEAARIDGASPRTLLTKITIPLLSPTIFFVTIIEIIGVLQIFDEPYFLTNGGPGTKTKTMSLMIYQVAFEQLKMGWGSTLAFMMFIIVLAITIIQFYGQKKWVNYDYE
jgi:multiple sugar transport system permease protein